MNREIPIDELRFYAGYAEEARQLDLEEVIEEVDSEGYDLDENGNRLICCGDVLDDYMICPSCKEYC